jgi:hypothetical protein
MNYILALRLYIRRRAKGARGGVVSVRVRDVCIDDKKCEYVVYTFLTELVKKGVAQKYKQGVYVINKATLAELV